MSLLRSSSAISSRVVPPWVVSYSTGLGGGGNLETRPPEPPFLNINVNSPIVRSWNGWDFVINRPDIATPTLSNRLRTYKLRFTSHSEKEKAPPISSRTSDIDKATPAQISFILLKLRDEIPQFFTGCHSYSILYEKDMTFENKIGLLKCSLKYIQCHHFPFNFFSRRSRLSYKMYLNSLRHGLCSIYSNVNCDLIKITKDITSSKIEARWRITGKPSLIPSSNTRCPMINHSYHH
jgi:hypothetical protein